MTRSRSSSPTALLSIALCLAIHCLSLASGQSTNCSVPPSCPTTAVAVPAPWYGLSFATNPTQTASPTYGWELTDAGDASCQYQHQGIVSLNSTLAQLIDLNIGAGSANSTGTKLPGIIGGQGSSAGSVASGTAGWSFEVTFRPNPNAAFSKLYSIGAGPYNAVIYSGTEGGGANFGVGLFDSVGTGNSGHSADFTLITPIVAYTWYHVVFVQQYVVTANITHGAWFMYVNGVMQTFLGATEDNLLPTPVLRPAAYLGKSDWGDPAWGGLIDTFNIYNYALTQSQVTARYAADMAGCPFTQGTAVPSNAAPNLLPRTTPTTTPTPYFTATFNTNPALATGATGYGWNLSLPTDSATAQQQRQGLIVLTGSLSQYVNLSAATGANTIGQVLPVVGGGTTGWSFEAMVQPLNGGADTWPKLFDLGGVRGSNGFCNNDIVLGWSGAAAAPDSFWQFDVCDNTTAAYQYSTIDAVGEIFDNVWYHFVVTISPPMSNGLANYFTYVNGQLYTTVVNVFYPVAAPRQNSLLGKSNWPDPYFSGAIDFFNVYNSQLSDVQVANLYTAAGVTAPNNNTGSGGSSTGPATVCSVPPSCPTTAVAVPAPWYGLSFATNPTQTASPTYGWELTDAGDASCQYQHQGIVSLNSTLAQLIDLNIGAGSANSTGTKLPGIIGGQGSSAGSVASGTAGWSFEVTFRPNPNAAFSKLYSIGAGPYNAVIYSGTEGGGANFGVGLFDSVGTGNSGHSADFTLITPIVAYTWYHVVFVQQYVVTANITHGAWFMYVNGVMQTFLGATEDNLLPTPVLRPAAYLGKSDWGDPAWGGLIDTFNIYNYALTQSQVTARYAADMAGCPFTQGTAVPSNAAPNLLPRTTPTTTPTPYFTATFNTNPALATGATGYGWNLSLPTDSATAQQQRQGLIVLTGSLSQYVNLSAATGANTIGQVLPVVGGGTTGWSFEAMVQPLNGGADTWPKLFDLGGVRGSNGFCNNDIVLGWSGAAAAPDSFWQFDVCDNTTAAYQYSTIDAVGEIFDNVWYHFVVTISPPMSNGLANYFTYVNGQLYTTVVNVFYPVAAPRQNSLLGKSNWPDPYFSGAIDFFNVYNSQLSDVQVANLYTAAGVTAPNNNTGSGGSSTGPATVCSVPPSCPTTAVAVPAPWYGLSFATNPTQTASPTYGWELTDAGDASCQYQHQGIVSLNSTLAQLIDLNIGAGSANSTGTKLPGIIGGQGSSAGSVASGTAGWSFEVTFRPNPNAAFSKLYSIGAGPYNAVIYSGTEGGGANFGVGLFDSVGTGNSGHSADFTLITPIVAYTWYHVVFVQQYVVTANITHGAWFMYVNGVMQTFLGATEDNLLPTPVLRPAAYLGKSDWGDPAWGGLIDTFNIYNYALTQSQVTARYAADMAGCPFTQGTAVPSNAAPNLLPRTTPTTTPTPYFTATFNTNPALATGATGYGWNLSLPTDSATAQQQRQGLIVLTGSLSQYVNLSAATGANTIGQVLPVVGGGTTGWSFEAMVQPLNGGADTWPKLFDLGGVRGSNGFCNNDIVLGWSGAAAAPDSFWQFDVCDNTTAAYQYSTIDAVGEIFDNVWYHFVVTISPPMSNGLANYFTYVNGQLYTTVVNVFYPVAAPRQNSLLGKSNWPDPYFSGAIDFFNVYNSQLSDVQVANLYTAAGVTAPNNNTGPGSIPNTVCSTPPACPATAVAVPAPWYGLSFGTNPTATTGATSPTFGWELNDAGDASCQYKHSGIVSLNSATAQLIDLNYANGANSSGSALPGIIGGQGSSAGSVASGTAGWSFEVTFRPNPNAAFSKLYSIGAGPYNAVIYSGTEGGGANFGVGLFDSVGTGNSGHSADFTLITPIVAYTWYHVVFVQQYVVTANITHGAWFMYVNGVMQTFLGATEDNLLPTPVLRPAAYLGKSDWGDPAWGGLIDTFNIYNYALTQSQVTARYAADMAGCPFTQGTAVPSNAAPNLLPRGGPSAVPAPYFALNFSVNPTTSTGATGYGWQQSLSTDSGAVQQLRTGLIVLTGSQSQYVNLSASSGANTVGSVLPTVGGGTSGWSFEVMVQPQVGGADTWPKVFDLGGIRGSNGFCVNDVVLGWSGAAVAPDSFWQFDVCDNTTAAYQYSTIDAVGEIFDNVWYHFVVTISPPMSNGLANYFTYVNGQLYTTVVNVFYPLAAPRPNSQLGKSNWADPYFSGAIDFFNVYNTQLNDNQVASLYTATLTPGGTAPVLVQSSSSSGASRPVSPSSSSSGGAASTSTGGGGGGGAGVSNSSGSSGLSGGAIAGIVIGSVVGALLILLILFFMVCRGGRGNKKSAAGEPSVNNNARHEQLGEEVSTVSHAGHETHYGEEEGTGGEVEMQ